MKERKYPKAFQCDNGSEFKGDVRRVIEKYKVDIQRTITKYKHTHTSFVKVFNKELAKSCLSPWMLKSFKTLKRYQQFDLKI